MRLLDEFGQLQNSDSNQRVLRSSKLLTHGTRIAVMRFLSIVSRCVLVGFRPLVRTAVIAVTMALAGTVLNRPCLGENSVRLTTRLVTARQMQRVPSDSDRKVRGHNAVRAKLANQRLHWSA